MHPKEIIAIAHDKGLMPDHLYGKTQYKTLAARLSTEIRENGVKSPFFRTGSNRFFLRDLNSKNISEYKAPKREKTLHHEFVLTINNKYLEEIKAVGMILNAENFIQRAFSSQNTSYIVRKIAEKRSDVKQVIAYTIIFRDNKILTYRRGKFTSASDDLLGKRSIGFGGHVSDMDLNLFDNGKYGVFENARRELMEELSFNKKEIKNIQNKDNLILLCGVNTYDSPDAEKHIALIVVYFCTLSFSPKKNEMSINDIKWTDLFMPENDMDAFEPWSKLLLSCLYKGELKIDRK